jgi:hypothetical protein
MRILINKTKYWKPMVPLSLLLGIIFGLPFIVTGWWIYFTSQSSALLSATGSIGALIFYTSRLWIVPRFAQFQKAEKWSVVFWEY